MSDEGQGSDTLDDAVLRVASRETARSRRFAIRIVTMVVAGFVALVVIGAIALTLVVSRLDQEHQILVGQEHVLEVSDCNRRLQAEYQDLSDQLSAAFNATSSNPDLGARISDPTLIALENRKHDVTVAQQNVQPGRPCPKP